MHISEYTKQYTSNRRIIFLDVLDECREFIIEVAKFNRAGIKEEFGDIFHFLQLWLFSRFGIDGEHWRITDKSVQKFMARKKIWNQLYVTVGLSEDISGYVGNYAKKEKVVRQLGRFGVTRDRAEQAYEEVVKL